MIDSLSQKDSIVSQKLPKQLDLVKEDSDLLIILRKRLWKNVLERSMT